MEPAPLEVDDAVVAEAAPNDQPDPDAPVRIVAPPQKVSVLSPHSSQSLFNL